MLYYVYIISCQVTSYHVALLCYAMLCYVMPCYVVLCYVTLHATCILQRGIWMPSLPGWPLIVYYLTLPRPNLSGWEVADVWLVLTGPLLPLPFHTFAFKIQSETWGSFLTKNLASHCTSTSSLAPAIISSASCVSLFVLQRCSRPRTCICHK